MEYGTATATRPPPALRRISRIPQLHLDFEKQGNARRDSTLRRVSRDDDLRTSYSTHDLTDPVKKLDPLEKGEEAVDTSLQSAPRDAAEQDPSAEASVGLKPAVKELAALVASMDARKKKKVAISYSPTNARRPYSEGLDRAIAATKDLEMLSHAMATAQGEGESVSKQTSSSHPDITANGKQTRCRLLELPGELRNRIYKLVLVADEPVLVSGDNAQETQWKQLRLG